MNYLGIVLFVVIVSYVVAYFESKYKKLSPPGKFNPSLKSNFVRNLLKFSIIVALILLIQLWF